jgi:hypothetical protein
MIQVYVRLENPSDILILDALDGWGILNIDLGDSATRESVQDAPNADGTLDYTGYLGARIITVSMELVEFSQDLFTMQKRIAGFLRPRVPTKFFFKLTDTAPVLYADVRRSSWSSPLDNQYITHPVLQWVAPKGVFETEDVTITTINPAGTGTEIGRTYDRTYDRVYPASPVLGSGIVTNKGNVEAYPLLRVYGPCTDPAIYQDTQGYYMSFVGLTINAGEFLEIDTRNKTIRYLGLPSDSRYDRWDPAVSHWFTLDPDVNQIRFIPLTSSPGSILEISHHDTYNL